MELHSFFRSSASHRVRIGLALKGLSFDYRPVHLIRNEQASEAFETLNPHRAVPVLVDGEHVLTQSLSILEYLEETHPEPPLLPSTPHERARVRSLAQDMACDLHPLTNLRVLRYLVQQLGAGEDVKNAWVRHWVEQGLGAIEERLNADKATGMFCHGYGPGLADCVLVPQVVVAQRFGCPLDHVPKVMRIFEACMGLPAFQQAHPDQCPDAGDASAAG